MWLAVAENRPACLKSRGMDNFLLQAIVTELEPILVGRRVGRVYQLGATGLMIDLQLRDGKWLAISTDPNSLALYLTDRSPKQSGESPRSDTAFVAHLKKHLSNARMVALEKIGYDRVVKFDFDSEEDGVKKIRLTLVVMLTGRSANTLLLEDSMVVASLRERDEALTGYTDPAPPADKIDPFLCSAEKLEELIAGGNGDIAAVAQRHLIGFSTVYARELADRAQKSTPDEALNKLLASLFEAKPSPAIYSSQPLDRLDNFGKAIELIIAPIALAHLASYPRTDYPSVNEAAAAYFSLLNQQLRFTSLKQRLSSHLSGKIKKQRGLVNNLRRELEGFSNAGVHQRYGELLLANLHQVKKAGAGFEVTDFYDPAQPAIEIPSANKATPQEAAEHYFKLARKARNGRELINKRLPEIERELAALEALRIKADSITRLEDLISLGDEGGLPESAAERVKKTFAGAKKVKAEKLTGVRRYRSTDGYEILVGRTDRDNDNLTLRIAKSYDFWFHAADYPGSHVVLRNPQRKQLPARAITEAAQLAAKFSQAKGDAKVAVNYCERKFVTKMKGAAPGQVRLSSFKTVLVEPGEAGDRIL
jgi:predicted ribosome quality control (RQC) complex YloA/Tae2 family protein